MKTFGKKTKVSGNENLGPSKGSYPGGPMGNKGTDPHNRASGDSAKVFKGVKSQSGGSRMEGKGAPTPPEKGGKWFGEPDNRDAGARWRNR